MKILPILLTLIAGFSTIIGYFFIYIKAKRRKMIISSCLSFSAGVILGICFFDLLAHPTIIILQESRSGFISFIYLILFFLIGYMMIYILKKIELNSPTDLYRVGIVSFLVLFFHNFLEGVATYSLGVYDINLGMHFTLAIVMHNIPEGILIAIPIYYSTKNRLKAFKLVLISSIAEPIGAIVSFILFKNVFSELFINLLMIIIAGLMISLVINEIYKEIKKYKEYKIYNILYFIIGIIFIMLNIYIF